MAAPIIDPRPGPPPRLENGDHLDREEFERRYEAMPDTRAELIEGVVYVSSPVSLEHAQPHFHLSGWLVTYVARHPECDGGDNATWRVDDRNEFQPDLFLRRRPDLPVQGKYLETAPELVIEIAATSASIDLHRKKAVYRRHGVREYIVWRTVESGVDWFRLEAGEYVRVEPGEDGIIESAEFPGLRLDVPALLGGDLAQVLAAVR